SLFSRQAKLCTESLPQWSPQSDGSAAGPSGRLRENPAVRSGTIRASVSLDSKTGFHRSAQEMEKPDLVVEWRKATRHAFIFLHSRYAVSRLRRNNSRSAP